MAGRIELKTREQMRVMARAGVIVEQALAAAQSACVPGARTLDADSAAARVIAEPA